MMNRTATRRGTLRSGHARGVRTPTLETRRVFRDELRRRIEALPDQIGLSRSQVRAIQVVDEQASRPRWLRTSEFVARMRPFLIYN